MGAADIVFGVPELLELILLALPADTTHQEISSMRTIILSRTTCKTWHCLIQDSTTIRRRLYLPTVLDASNSKVWQEQSAFPPSRPNPFVPQLLLNQRSWGSAYPFDNVYSIFGSQGSTAKHWTFSFEISRSQYARLPSSGGWRDMLVCDPPFNNVWATRTFYELGSGRAPFVTHVDYDPRLPKSMQHYSASYSHGFTLGDMVDTIRGIYEEHSSVRFVLVENVRIDSPDERPQ